MIEEIYIRDLGVIQEARLPFGKGLTVITGETGAGKTMVLSALGLLLGERADTAAIRRGQEQAFPTGPRDQLYVAIYAFVSHEITAHGAKLIQ